MPILDQQRRVAVIGHIRLGERVESRSGRMVPRALHGFRFTSPQATVIEQVCTEWGGELTNWQHPNGTAEFQCTTTATALPVLVPPADLSFSQHYELWTEAGCQRRCDGFTETRGEEPRNCPCAEAGTRECDAVTRLNLLLPALRVFGVFRLVTSSYYASGELRSAVELALGLAQRRAENLAAANLRLEQRVAKRPGQPPSRYTLPVLDVLLDPYALSEGVTGTERPALTPKPSDANREAAAALSVVALPDPAPRIDRGEPSPAPGMLDDDDADAPAFGDAFGDRQLSPTPPPESHPPVTDPDAEHVARRRRMFAKCRDLWPTLTDDDRSERRYCLAMMVTGNRPNGPVTSWSDLTLDELATVEARLSDLANGRMTMEPVPRGYVFALRSGRALTLQRDDTGKWQHVINESGHERTEPSDDF